MVQSASPQQTTPERWLSGVECSGQEPGSHPPSGWVVTENAHPSLMLQEEAEQILTVGAQRPRLQPRVTGAMARSRESRLLLVGGLFRCARCGSVQHESLSPALQRPVGTRHEWREAATTCLLRASSETRRAQPTASITDGIFDCICLRIWSPVLGVPFAEGGASCIPPRQVAELRVTRWRDLAGR